MYKEVEVGTGARGSRHGFALPKEALSAGRLRSRSPLRISVPLRICIVIGVKWRTCLKS